MTPEDELIWVEREEVATACLDARPDWLWETVQLPRPNLLHVMDPAEDAGYRLALIDVVLAVLLAGGSAASAAIVDALTTYRPGLEYLAVCVALTVIARVVYTSTNPPAADVRLEVGRRALTVVHRGRRESIPLDEVQVEARDGEWILTRGAETHVFPVETSTASMEWLCERIEERKAAHGSPRDVPKELRSLKEETAERRPGSSGSGIKEAN